MIKDIHKANNVRAKVLSGLDAIAGPVTETLSPRGRNVLFEAQNGDKILSNDGITIAKNIHVSDPVEDSIVEIVREGSLKTNIEAGDGTSSTILLSNLLIREGLRLIDDGHSWIEVRDGFNKMGDALVARLEKVKKEIKSDTDLEGIARISSNNDPRIAKDVVDIVKTSGETGLVMMDRSNNIDTEIIKDLGFMIRTNGYFEELFDQRSVPSVEYHNVPILITDTRLYYKEDCEHILRKAIEAGYKDLVVVARDFIGESPNVFIANHKRGKINVLLIKDNGCNEQSCTSLHDLALYLGAKVMSEKGGTLVNKMTEKDLTMINRVYADPEKALFTPQTTASKELKELIKSLKEDVEKNKDDEKSKARLASLTKGIVTVKIGGATDMEAREKAFRYEDAINATRAAMRQGYIPGGGVTLMNAYEPKDYDDLMRPIAKRFTESIVNQIAINSGKHPETIVENIKDTVKPNAGYNALTDSYDDMIEAGVIEPFLVAKMGVLNSISVANIIISIGNYILINRDEYEREKEKGGNN